MTWDLGTHLFPAMKTDLFPLTPALSLGERESAGTPMENSDVAVAVPASLSFVLEAYDNQTRCYYQRVGKCFSLSPREKAGVRGKELSL